MNNDREPKAFINEVGQLVIQGLPEGMRDDRAYIALEDWDDIRRQADGAILDYAERLLREYLP